MMNQIRQMEQRHRAAVLTSECQPMPIKPTIRHAVPADAECLSVLATQVWLHTYATDGVSNVIAQYVLAEFSAAKFAAILAQEHSTVLVAEVNGHTMGYALVNTGVACAANGPCVEVASLYVQAHFAGQGIGSALLRDCQRLALQRTGSAAIWLTVNAKNYPAIAFYKKHGLAQTGTAYFELGGEKHENHVLASASVLDQR
jgi:diamine N-acetyltransferase